jgi:hypothetical protein
MHLVRGTNSSQAKAGTPSPACGEGWGGGAAAYSVGDKAPISEPQIPATYAAIAFSAVAAEA